MKAKAGEKLFEAIGRLPEEMLLEAEQDGLKEQAVMESVQAAAAQDLGQSALEGMPDQMPVPSFSEESAPAQGQRSLEGETAPVQGQPFFGEETAPAQGQRSLERETAPVDMSRGTRSRRRQYLEKLGGFLKYLPVVACLCIVFGSTYYITVNYYRSDKQEQFHFSGNESMTAEDTYDSGGMPGLEEGTSAAGGAEAADEKSEAQDAPARLPLRYDAYEGPILALTATGDTQKLKTSRILKGEVVTEQCDGRIQPLLHITDTYRIRNTSDENKALQLVYPFVTTLNLAYDLEGDILQVQDEDDLRIAYGIGDGISASRGKDPAGMTALKDYRQLLDAEGNYQDKALEKEADWDREVSVYTFSEAAVDGGYAASNSLGVIGVTVTGKDADVLTYGFDYSSEMVDGVSNHCFFIPDGRPQAMLIVTGEQEREPTLGYYTNLDCEEALEGIQCTMQKRVMTYSDVLRLCSATMVKKLEEDYAQGVYAGKLPEYMNAGAAYRALTMISEEEAFYDTLVQRCRTTELNEAFEKLLAQTRVVYAMATVMIPAKQSLKVTVRTQKRQSRGHYEQAGTRMAQDEEYRYDLLTNETGHLHITQAVCRLILPQEWQAAGNSLGLRQKKKAWEADLKEGSGYIVITLLRPSEMVN